MDKGIVSQLVVGSEAVNRMRKEITSVVKMIFGLLKQQEEFQAWEGWRKSVAYSDMDRCEISSHKYIWRFWTKETGSGKPTAEWNAECYLVSESGRSITLAFTTAPHGVPLDSWWSGYVQPVHESLPVFIEGMRKNFPFLEKGLKPLLAAADYAEKNGWNQPKGE